VGIGGHPREIPLAVGIGGGQHSSKITDWYGAVGGDEPAESLLCGKNYLFGIEHIKVQEAVTEFIIG